MFKICFTKTSLTCISLQWPFHIFSSIFNVNNPIFTIACKFYFIFIRKKKFIVFVKLFNCYTAFKNSYISYWCLLCCFNIMSTVWKTCTQWYELVLIIFFYRKQNCNQLGLVTAFLPHKNMISSMKILYRMKYIQREFVKTNNKNRKKYNIPSPLSPPPPKKGKKIHINQTLISK